MLSSTTKFSQGSTMKKKLETLQSSLVIDTDLIRGQGMILSLLREKNPLNDKLPEKLYLNSNQLSEEENRALIIWTLRKEPHSRSDAELTFLEKNLEGLKFLQDTKQEIGAESFSEIFKELRCEQIEKGMTVFNMGDIGRKFYIVIEGSVYILVPQVRDSNFSPSPKKPGAETRQSQRDWKLSEMNLNRIEESPTFSPTKSPTHKNNSDGSSSFREVAEEASSPHRKRTEALTEEMEILKILSDHRGFKIVNTLKSGTSFGEIAIKMQVPRMATVVCRENTTFGVLKGETFQRIMRLYNEKIYRQSLQFLRDVPLFSNWTLNEISIINLLAKVNSYLIQNTIFEEGDTDDNIYIIKEGEVEIIKTVSLKLANRKWKSTKSSENGEYQEGQEEDGVGKMLSKNLKRPITLVRLGPYQFFGSDSFFEESKRETKAVVKSLSAKVYIINRKELLNNVRSMAYAKEIHGLLTLVGDWMRDKFKKIQNNFQNNLEEKATLEISFEGKITEFLRENTLLHNLKLSNMKRVQNSININATEEYFGEKRSITNPSSDRGLKRAGSLLDKLFVDNQINSREKQKFKRPIKIDYNKIYKMKAGEQEAQNVIVKKANLSNISPILTISAVSTKLKSIENSRKKGKSNINYDVGNIASQYENDLKKQIGQYLFKNKLLPTESLKKYVVGDYHRSSSQMDSRDSSEYGKREEILYRTLKIGDERIKRMKNSQTSINSESLDHIKQKYSRNDSSFSPKNGTYFQGARKFFKRDKFKQIVTLSDPNSLVSTGVSFFRNLIPHSTKSGRSNGSILSDEKRYN